MRCICSKRKFHILLSIPTGTEMFHFPAFAPSYKGFCPTTEGFPHSDISGSKVDWHLAETYRSHSTSFIALYNLGIHHTPLHSHRECCTPLCNFLSVVFAYLRRLCDVEKFSKKIFQLLSAGTCLCVSARRQGRKDPSRI